MVPDEKTRIDFKMPGINQKIQFIKDTIKKLHF